MVYSTIPYMHVAYVVLGLSSCSTNGLLVWIIFRKRRLRTKSNIIIASLSISDFLLGATIAPVEVAHTLQTNFTIVGYGCLAHQVMMIYIPLVSILHLLVVALERFVKIVYPLRYVIIITSNKVAGLIVLAWTVPLHRWFNKFACVVNRYIQYAKSFFDNRIHHVLVESTSLYETELV
ncbi:histamine H2 receptor-like [Mytilus trossulus]|uniref:histamine H2 receptor-like n=1 Tax=Mytilus trossulus TaxID=6551 RepID=UPI003004E268